MRCFQPTMRPFADGGGQGVPIHRPVDIVLHVLLARPDHLDRPVHLLGDLHGGVDHVHLQPAAEAAADEVVVHGDFVERQSGDLRRDRLGPGEHLNAHPHLAGGGRDMHGAVHRLHGGMREKGQFVGSLEQYRPRPSPWRHRPPIWRPRLPFSLAARSCFQTSSEETAACGPSFQRDVECVQPLLGRPHVIADDRHEILEHDDLTHAGQTLGFGVIDMPHSAAEHRAGGEGRELQAGRHGIDSVHDLAVDLVRRVEPLQRVADQFEIVDVLERRILRRA